MSGARLTDIEADLIESISAGANYAIMTGIAGIIVASPFDLSGFVLCDGSSYQYDDYPALGALYGAGAGDSFSVPDLRDKFILGASASSPASTIGGASSVTLSEANLPPHSHSTLPHSHSESGAVLGAIEGLAGAGAIGALPVPAITAPATIDIGITGSGEAFNILPPFYALKYLISTGDL
jgi:microcystin-dependent protein